MLLHWYTKLDHVNFKQLRDLDLRDYIPKIYARAKPVKCLAYQQGKDMLSKTDKNDKIVKESDIEFPGNIVYMDQVEYSTPGRPLTFSGRNNKKKICVVSLFVDSIFKRVFCEFQHSSSASETVESKR